MLCKNCEFLKKDKTIKVESLKDRKYHCDKYQLGIVLKSIDGIETLKCINIYGGNIS